MEPEGSLLCIQEHSTGPNIESPKKISEVHNFLSLLSQKLPRQLSQYSDRLRAGRPRGRSSCPDKVKNFHFFISSRPVLGSTHFPIQWVLGAFPRDPSGSIHPLPHMFTWLSA
jgi:hypothetical protein